MAKMANWGEVNAKVGSSGSPTNRCPTKSMIEATGKATVTSGYASNQLVPLSAVYSPSPPLTDNIIFLSISKVGSTTWQVSASAEYNVASLIFVSGAYVDDFSEGNRYFSLTIASGSSSGFGYIEGVPEFAVGMMFEYANCSPPYDSTYRYTAKE